VGLEGGGGSAHCTKSVHFLHNTHHISYHTCTIVHYIQNISQLHFTTYCTVYTSPRKLYFTTYCTLRYAGYISEHTLYLASYISDHTRPHFRPYTSPRRLHLRPYSTPRRLHFRQYTTPRRLHFRPYTTPRSQATFHTIQKRSPVLSYSIHFKINPLHISRNTSSGRHRQVCIYYFFLPVRYTTLGLLKRKALQNQNPYQKQF
jgi:hypothetical protein